MKLTMKFALPVLALVMCICMFASCAAGTAEESAEKTDIDYALGTGGYSNGEYTEPESYVIKVSGTELNVIL